jgi:3-oxoadipate enol-lactonase
VNGALETRSVETRDGLRLHLEGTGHPTALMIHGLGYASWEARILRGHLGDESGLWSVDNRGTGLSDPSAGACSIDQLADDAAAAVRELGAPLTIVGHSMGGYVALTLALRHPELVRDLALIATSPGGRDSSPVPDATVRAWMDAAGSEPAEYARRTMPLSFRPEWAEEHPAEFEEILAARLAHPTSPDVWRSQFDAAERYLATGVDAGLIAVPALVVHGTEDRVVPVENGRLLARRIPGARYHEVTGAGHLVHLEKPRAISRLITNLTPHHLT